MQMPKNQAWLLINTRKDMALSLPVVPVDALLPRLPGWRRYKWLWAVAIVFFGANRVLNRSFTLLLFG